MRRLRGCSPSMTHEVLIPPKAVAEIEAIADYIAQDDPGAAARVVWALYERIQSLDTFPERGRRYGPRYRAVNEGAYVIFYRVETAQVVVVAVMHGARDIAALLDPE